MSILLAMLLDAGCRELPNSLHPVVWIGRYLKLVGRRLTALKPMAGFVAGALLWFFGAVLFTGIFWLIEYSLQPAPLWARWLALAFLLKPLFALRLLTREVSAVEAALAVDLRTGRQQLSRIVSRDTSRLSATEVRESALESLSENLSDSVVAPLFWFALFGLPGAALYRFANTADAMWGYRGDWEWAGKWAARADDCLNFIPARLTALALMLTRSPKPGLFGKLPREATKTPSPNSGWPMAALALTHGIRLGKPGVYVLNPDGQPPGRNRTAICIRHARLTGWLLALLLSLVSFFHWRLRHG